MLVSAQAASNCRRRAAVRKTAEPSSRREDTARERVLATARLELRQVVTREKLYEARHHAGFDDLLNWRAALCSSESRARAELQGRVAQGRAALHTQEGAPIDSSLRNCVVASSCTAGSSLHTPCTMTGSCSSCVGAARVGGRSA